LKSIVILLIVLITPVLITPVTIAGMPTVAMLDPIDPIKPLPLIVTSRSLTGIIKLDFGVASKDYSVTVQVRRHTIKFQQVCTTLPFGPPLCTFRTTYPIEETFSDTSVIRAGTSSAGYRVSGISLFGLGYSIKYICSNCAGVIPQQFFTLSGNATSFSSAVVLDSDELPSQLNFTLDSNAIVSGRISLAEGMLAEEDKSFSVSVLSSSSGNGLIAKKDNIILPRNTNGIAYTVTGIPRITGGSKYIVRVNCNNCAGFKRIADFPGGIRRGIDVSGVNFVAELEDGSFLPAIILNLL